MAITLDGTAGINTSGSLTTTGSVISGSTITSTSSLTTGTGAVYNGLQASTAVASTSGTSIDFTAIPSWVKRITVMLSNISTNGGNGLQIQLGTGSTTYTTTGYNGSCGAAGAFTPFSSAFVITNTVVAARNYFGQLILSNLTSNNWIESSNIGSTNDNTVWNSGGGITLGAVLTAIRITTINGIDTFDAGSINILYE